MHNNSNLYSLVGKTSLRTIRNNYPGIAHETEERQMHARQVMLHAMQPIVEGLGADMSAEQVLRSSALAEAASMVADAGLESLMN